MIETDTVVLGLLALAVVVYVLGLQRTTLAVRRTATSGYTAAIAGLGVGLQFGAELVTVLMTDPFQVLTVVAGLFGALGIEGIIDISGVQFILLGLTVFALVWAYSERRNMMGG